MLNSCTSAKSPKDVLKVKLLSAPYSMDPLDYDAFVHHVTARAVLSPVLSLYQVGKVTPLVANEWKPSADYKTWSFTIRTGIFFENGDPITPEVVQKSWQRMAYLQYKKGSRSGLFEKLEGCLTFSSENPLESSCQGIQVNGNAVVLRFKEPMPNLLELIGFGLYSIAHPQDYNPKTGEWKDQKKVTASGAYQVLEWKENELVLKLRENVSKNFHHSRAFKKIQFFWGEQSTSIAYDIVMGADIKKPKELENTSIQYEFKGATPSNIAYVRLYSWSDSRSPLSDLLFRKNLRQLFYEELKKMENTDIVKSFFPLAIKGVKVAEISEEKKATRNSIKNYVLKIRESTLDTPYAARYANALAESVKNFEVKAKLIQMKYADTLEQRQANLKTYELDFSYLGTGILIDQPEGDIRFMFESKEGIQLPDTTGEITQELKKSVLDIPKINQLLWDQAVIWPLGHFSLGLWVRREINFTAINTTLPPTELQWVYLK